MRRHQLIFRSHQQHWMAHTIVSRRSLVQRGKRHQQLALELGVEVANTSGGLVTPLSFDQHLRTALTSQDHSLHPPILESIEKLSSTSIENNRGELAEDQHKIPFFPDRLIEVHEPQTANSVPSPTLSAPIALPNFIASDSTRGEEDRVGMDAAAPRPIIPLAEHGTTAGRDEASPGAIEVHEPHTTTNVPSPEPTQQAEMNADRLLEQMTLQNKSPISRQFIEQEKEIATFEVENLRAKSEQPPNTFSANITPLNNSKRAKHPQNRIQEQPTSARPTQPVSPIIQRQYEEIKQTVRPQETDIPIEKIDQTTTSTNALFTSRGTDRSPQAWLARLEGKKSRLDNLTSSETVPITDEQDEKKQADVMKEPESKLSTIARDQSVAYEHATRDQMLVAGRTIGISHLPQEQRVVSPLSSRTLRFLRPLLGIDPASIQVHRDQIAERLTDKYRADAITMDGNVELAAGHQENTPETVGILAHEFTHVARLREPHFIPPIVRSSHSPMAVSSQASSIDEEALAIQVEEQVKEKMQMQINQGETALSEPLYPFSNQSVATASSPPLSHLQGETWGGLPAPWEPLPDWLAPTSASQEKVIESFVNHPPFLPENQYVRGRENSSGGTESRETQTGKRAENLGIQRAGKERSLSMEEVQATSDGIQGTTDTLTAPQLNLDILAQQVYTRLKRRLGVECRREG